MAKAKQKLPTLLDLVTNATPRWHIYQIVDVFRQKGLNSCNRNSIRQHLEMERMPTRKYREAWCELFDKSEGEIKWM